MESESTTDASKYTSAIAVAIEYTGAAIDALELSLRVSCFSKC